MYRLTQTLYPAELETVGVILVQGVSRLCEGNALIHTCLSVPRIQRNHVGKMVQALNFESREKCVPWFVIGR